MPTWLIGAAELAVELGKAIAAAVAGRKLDVEAARLALIPRLRGLAVDLEGHAARDQADHDAAVAEAVAAEVARRKAEGLD